MSRRHRVQMLRPRIRGAFTLLEVLLTLSMSVVLMLLIGGAMQYYGRDMSTSDLDARQTQLAAAVIQMIEDDLRSTLHPEPIDTSGLEELLSSVASQGGGGGDQGDSGDEDLSAAGLDDMADESTMSTDMATVDLTSGAAVLQRPGLIGNQYQIQVDISRLPRLEEYMAMMDTSVVNIDDVPSDLKTVTYYVQPAGLATGVADPLSTLDADPAELSAGGLIRRSLDRAATSYATLNASLATLNQTGELLAPEVVGIEFSYWDGITWQIEWSSDTYGELPLAVRVTLQMMDPYATDPESLADPQQAMRTFTHLIRLPLARPIEEESEDDEMSEVTGI